MSFHDINFATHRAVSGWLISALMVLLAATACGAYRYATLAQATAAAGAQISLQRAQLQRRNEASESVAPELPKERVKAINEAIVALNTPWPTLLGALESARTRQVAFTRVEPRPKDRSVLVTAQADDIDALLEFMQRMRDSAPFVRVRPVRQEVVIEGGVSRKQATFEADWEERP